jgi:hypothetical protein
MHGSADPDPDRPQNGKDPEHWFTVFGIREVLLWILIWILLFFYGFPDATTVKIISILLLRYIYISLQR